MEINKKIYVQNADKFIYKVADLELRADGWANIWLDLVCGIDYINADEGNALGYVSKENFVEEIEHEFISCDMMNESITQALEYHGFTVVKGALSDLVSNGIQWGIGKIGELAGALMQLPEATKEYRTTFAAVKQSAADSAIGIDGAKKAYEEFYGVAADEGQAAEATSHLAGLVSSNKDLQSALDGVIGAWVEYGDSISIEGLSEAA